MSLVVSLLQCKHPSPQSSTLSFSAASFENEAVFLT